MKRQRDPEESEQSYGLGTVAKVHRLSHDWNSFTHSSSWAAGAVGWKGHSVGLMSQSPRFRQWLSRAHPGHCLSDMWWLTGFGQVTSLLWVSISPSIKWRGPWYLTRRLVKIQRMRWSTRNTDGAQWTFISIPTLFSSGISSPLFCHFQLG